MSYFVSFDLNQHLPIIQNSSQLHIVLVSQLMKPLEFRAHKMLEGRKHTST